MCLFYPLYLDIKACKEHLTILQRVEYVHQYLLIKYPKLENILSREVKKLIHEFTVRFTPKCNAVFKQFGVVLSALVQITIFYNSFFIFSIILPYMDVKDCVIIHKYFLQLKVHQ